MPEGLPDGIPEALPEGAPDGVPDGAPLGRPEAFPVGIPLGIPDGGEHDCRAELPPAEDEEAESLEPQAVSSSGDRASRTTAGTRRARFMRDDSKADEEFLRNPHPTSGG